MIRVDKMIKKYSVFFWFSIFLSHTVFALPEIQHWQTANGGQVYFVPAPELPMLDVHLVFDAGSARDGTQNGIAMLTNGLLNQGTANMTADQIVEKLDSLGVQVGFEVDRDSAMISLRSLTDSSLLSNALNILSDFLAKPDFNPTAFKRNQQQLLMLIKQKQQSPRSLASDAFYHAIFAGHPYENPEEGTEETVKMLTPMDTQAFHHKYYVAKNAVIAIVGAVDKTQAAEIANQLLAKLPEGEQAAALPPVKSLTEGKIIHIEHPSTQTTILMGQVGIERQHPDYFPLLVANHALGGSGFASLLVEEVREKRGLAYSAYSYLSPLKSKGVFMMGAQTRNEQAEQTIEVIKQTLQQFMIAGVSPEKWAVIKANLTGSFPLKLDSNAKIVANIANVGFYQLPLDYLNKYVESVNQTTNVQILTALRNLIQPDKFVIVTVGQTKNNF